jgi:hypothetical protein
MSKDELIEEFIEFLEDPVLRSWVQAYLEGDLESEDLVKAALDTLEQHDEAEES